MVMLKTSQVIFTPSFQLSQIIIVKLLIKLKHIKILISSMFLKRRHTRQLMLGCGGDLSKLGAGGNKLYWLLPPLYYYEFTKKTPQTIEQYALLVPYAENNFY
jgi:hypothetical protein